MNENNLTSYNVPIVSHDEVIPLIPEGMETSENHNNENSSSANETEEMSNNNNNNNTMSSNDLQTNPVVQAQQEQSLLQRGGLAVRDYLIEFLEYLRVRTGFRPNQFRAPDELQRAMQQMERSNLPMSVWHAFMNASMRLIATNRMSVSTSNIVDVIIRVVSIVAEYFMDNILIRSALWLLSFFGAEQLSAIIMLIYYFASFSAKKLLAYIQKKLKVLFEFTAEQVTSHLHIQIKEN